MDTQKINQQIQSRFQRAVEADKKIHNAYLLVESRRHGLDFSAALGQSQRPDGSRLPAHTDQPVFMASVGKLFTAVLIGLLVEQGKLRYEDTLAAYLDDDVLHNLHVFKGVDYSREIRLSQLLNHTSGLHDYFEDKPPKGEPMLNIILNQPQRRWTPREVITWSKENLPAHSPPGKKLHYSDTGYHLLGLVIESVTAMPFAEALHRFIFEPLGMNHAFVIGHSRPLEDSPHGLAGVYFGDQNVIDYASLSIDYAGGGVTAPLGELLVFLRALADGKILRPATLERMRSDTARFSIGIDYGYGTMLITTVPLIMPARFNCWGNAGSTGAFLFYHPLLDACLIGSFNQAGYAPKAIRFMLQIVDLLWKEIKPAA
jgi:CubicO group peptidase (beta-lactamase class C family)